MTVYAPQPGPPPRPADIRRGYLAAGHAPASAPADGSPVMPVPHPVNADEFARGLITAGHEAQTPGVTVANVPMGSVRTGAGRDLYADAAAAATDAAMRERGDHVSIPGIGPLAPSRPVMPTGMQDTAAPRPYVPFTVPAAPGEESS